MKSSYTNKEQYYNDYLGLEKILDAQFPESVARGIDAHDEMLFIIIHQAYELWFKQILHELDSIIDIFSTSIDDNSPDFQVALHRTNRIVEIWRLLVSQVTVLETMTSMDFLDFRDLLSPASGFQSVQFRILEAKLGLKMEHRHESKYYEYQLRGEHVNHIKSMETKATLFELIAGWLERMPFWKEAYWSSFSKEHDLEGSNHPFWEKYRKTYLEGLNNKELQQINMTAFDNMFLGAGESNTRLSAKACQSVLFINLYRDYPLLQMPFQFLQKWLEIDELMSMWRYRHMSMVRRMIGMRVGTGGSSGAAYLKGAMEKHYIFGDFTQLTTYLIPRHNLPKLPKELSDKLKYVDL